MLKIIINNFHIILFMARQQIRNQYSGTFLGMIWAILHPLLLLSVFWLVFTIGFKAQVVGNRPFLLGLFCGLLVWMPFGEAVGGAVQSIVSRSYLIKKITFPVEILPFVTVLSSMFTHFIAFILLMFMFIYYGCFPGLGVIMLPYYFFCLIFLLSGLAWLLSAINVFYRDASQAVGVALNLWFWTTPIVWDPAMLPERYRFILKINPLSYIIEGYRSSLLDSNIILPPVEETFIFMTTAVILWIMGSSVFIKLRPSFGDVL